MIVKFMEQRTLSEEEKLKQHRDEQARQNAINTGRWWNLWKRAEVQNHIHQETGMGATELERVIHALSKVFGATWFKGSYPEHPMTGILLSPLWYSHDLVLETGRALATLGEDLPRQFLIALTASVDSKSFYGMLYHLRVWAYLREWAPKQGLTFLLEPCDKKAPLGKGEPDGVLSDAIGNRTYVEIHALQFSDLERKVRSLNERARQCLWKRLNAVGGRWEASIDFGNPYSLTQLEERVKVVELLSTNVEPPITTEQGGVKLTIIPLEGDDTLPGINVTGFDFPLWQNWVKRLFREIKKASKKTYAEEMPLILVVKSDDPLFVRPEDLAEAFGQSWREEVQLQPYLRRVREVWLDPAFGSPVRFWRFPIPSLEA